MTSMTEPRKVHEGHNLKRIREILQVKQATLAYELGGDWNQKKISQLEDREAIEPALLEEIAAALKVPVEAIRNFDDSKAVNLIAGTINNHDQSASVFYNCSINPVEKWMEALAENKQLYERLLESEKQKIAMLERLLERK